MAAERPEQFDVFALYTNHSVVTFTPAGVRIAFGESSNAEEDPNRIHTAVFMPHEVFAEVLTLFTSVRNRIKEMSQDQAPTPGAKSN